jgi:hypothetical protein
MRFSKQRFVIAILFLCLPFVAAFAFLQTPFVSDFVLQFSLRVTRFRTGVQVTAKSWDVNLLQFSAELSQVRIKAPNGILECPGLVIKISPVSLALGKLGIRSLEIKKPTLYGSTLNFGKGDEEKTQNDSFSPGELPQKLGENLIRMNHFLESKNLSFERLVIEDARVVLGVYSVEALHLDFENYGDGQARLQWKITNAQLGTWVEKIPTFEGSFVVLRTGRGKFDLILPRWDLSVGEDQGAHLEFTGRLPGDLIARGKMDLAKTAKAFAKSESISKNVPSGLSGLVNYEVTLGSAEKGIGRFKGKVQVTQFMLDGYHPNNIQFGFEGNDENITVKDLNLILPPDLGDLPQWKQRIFAREVLLDLKAKTFASKVEFDEAGLCGVLRATSVTDCPVSLKINGEADIIGNFSPFSLTGRPKFLVQETLVEGTDIPNYLTTPAVVRVNPMKLEGLVMVYPDYLDLIGIKTTWNENSAATTDGRIDFNPTIVSLRSQAEKVNLREMVWEFIGIQPEGEGKLFADIKFDERIPAAEGRTQVDARVAIDAVGLERQYFGLMTGPFSYRQNKLFIGPLKVVRGGGKASVRGELTESPTGPRLSIDSQLDRIEVQSRIEGLKEDLFQGFVSGSVSLEGSTNPEREDFLRGPLKLRATAIKFLGIPFQKGSGGLTYEKQNLKINDFVIQNNSSFVKLSGELKAIKGTEVNFESDAFPVSALNLNSGLNELQDGKLQIKGFWKPSAGWGAAGRVFDIKNGGRKFPDGTINVGGTDREFHLDFQMTDLLKLSYKNRSSPGEDARPAQLNATVKDEGFYALFSYLKSWKSDVNVQAKGSIKIDWEPTKGSFKASDLKVYGPSRRDGKVGLLLSLPNEQLVSWENGKVVRNSFLDQGASQNSTFVLKGDEGQSSLGIQFDATLGLIDLFVPNISFLQGTLVGSGTIPLNPDISTIQMKANLEDGVLLVNGTGKTVEGLSSELLVSGQSLFINQGRGRLGSGEVLVGGVYKLDPSNPGASIQFNLNKAQLVLMDDVPVDVSGDVYIRGEKLPYELGGRAQISNATYSKEFQESESFLPLVPDPVFVYNLDVDLLQDVKVKNSLSDLVVGGKFLMSGTDIEPRVKGRVQIQSGRVFANENVFNVSQGNVEFPGNYPTLPLVNLQANTQLKADGVDYRIDLKIRGSADNLAFDFSSDPGLETTQIINLLAFGMVRRTDDNFSLTGDLAGAATVEAFQALFGKALGSNINSTTGFQVKFRAAPDQSQKEFIPKIMVSRKLSDRVTATFGRSLDVDKPENNVQVDYKLFNNVNLTGVWEQGSEPKDSSLGMDLRFKFDLK